MKRYQVQFIQSTTVTMTVEAEDSNQAEEIAYDGLPDLCAQCSGMGPTDEHVISQDRYLDSVDEEQTTVVELDADGCAIEPDQEEAPDAA